MSAKGELFHVVRGDGPALLVLSAIGTRPYERQIPESMSRRFKVVFVDVRGTGRSPGEAADLTFDQLAADLDALRAGLGEPRMIVLAHSALGALAIEAARRLPGTISHAIAVGTPPFGDMTRLAAESQAFFERDASEDRKRILRENLAALPPGTPPSQAIFAQTPLRFFDPHHDAAPLFEGADVKPAAFQHIFGTLLADWDVTAAADLRVPLLLAHGRYDYVVPHVLWEGVVERIPGATMRLFDRSGHQPFVDEPAAFTETVAAWVGK